MRRLLAFTLTLALGCATGSSNDGGVDAGMDAGTDASVSDAGESDGGGDAGSTDGGLSFAALCAQVSEGACSNAVACGQLEASLKFRCVDSYRSGCVKTGRFIDGGSLQLAQAKVDACLAALQRGACGAGLGPPPECNAPWDFTGRIGAPCDFYECVEGYCPYGGAAPACTACTAFAQVNQPCTTFNSCNPATSYCPFSDPADGGIRRCVAAGQTGDVCASSLTCASRACVNFGVLDGGASRCGPQPNGAPCSSSGDCAAQSFCRDAKVNYFGNAVTLGQCAARIATGTVCTDQQMDDGCVDPKATCLDGTCKVTPSYTRDAGATCDSESQCAAGAYCRLVVTANEDGGVANRGGTCVALVADGGTCADGVGCAPGLSCGGSVNRCAPTAKEGDACPFGSVQCGWNLVCSDFLTPGSPRCYRERSLGEACEQNQLPCHDGPCVAGHCAMPAANGMSCLSGRDCASQKCGAAGDGGQQCQPPCP